MYCNIHSLVRIASLWNSIDVRFGPVNVIELNCETTSRTFYSTVDVFLMQSVLLSVFTQLVTLYMDPCWHTKLKTKVWRKYLIFRRCKISLCFFKLLCWIQYQYYYSLLSLLNSMELTMDFIYLSHMNSTDLLLCDTEWKMRIKIFF